MSASEITFEVTEHETDGGYSASAPGCGMPKPSRYEAAAVRGSFASQSRRSQLRGATPISARNCEGSFEYP